jgi:uncharacterized protein (TIGR02757 family)
MFPQMDWKEFLMKKVETPKMSIPVKRKILSIYKQYHRPDYIGIDPLTTLRRFTIAGDLEVAGLIAAVLSHGRVETIIRNCEDLFRRIEWQPLSFLRDTDYIMKKKTFRGFKHRFNDGNDIALYLQSVDIIRKSYGSLERFFSEHLKTSEFNIKDVLIVFSETIISHVRNITGRIPRLFPFLTPSPAGGGACKRLNMYLRWMVRPDDGIDRGVWKHIPASHLIMPVDTHIVRIAAQLGLTRRKSADWRMAEEVTGQLRAIDPEDPVRFDFSLCRYGMLELRKGAA